MQFRLIVSVWMVLVVGALASRETRAARLQKRDFGQWVQQWLDRFKNQAHRWGIINPTCPERAELPCKKGFEIAKMCDQSKWTVLPYMEGMYGDFRMCWFNEYVKASKTIPACKKDAMFYAYSPYMYYPNPQHRHTKASYDDQGWPTSRKECLPKQAPATAEQQQSAPRSQPKPNQAPPKNQVPAQAENIRQPRGMVQFSA